MTMTTLTAEDVKALKVAELKEELFARGLAVSGLKKDVSQAYKAVLMEQLAERLHAALQEAETPDARSHAGDEAGEGQASALAEVASDAEDSATKSELHDASGAPSKVDPKEEEKPEKGEEQGVGGVMVEAEDVKMSDEAENADDIAQQVEGTEPAALDRDLAANVAEEETKEILDRVNTPPRPLSPMSPEPRSRRSSDRADSVVAGGSEKAKRSRSPSPVLNAPKRPRKRYNQTLPAGLSHLVHPPTSVLYITNLRRPMQLSILHEYLFDDESQASTDLLPPPKNPFANADYPGLWLSGVKDHAYATFSSVEAALDVVKRIEGVKWPEDTGDKVGVEFVDEDEVDRLVEREQFAWSNGRQKMVLKVEKDGEDGYRFDLSVSLGSGQQGGLARGSFDRPPPGVRGLDPRGPDPRRPDPRGQGRPAPFAPPLTGGPPRGGPPGSFSGRGGHRGDAGFGRTTKYTRQRPSIMWREGPGAVRS